MALTDGDLQKIGNLFLPRLDSIETNMVTKEDLYQTRSELLGAIHSQTAHLSQAIYESAQLYVLKEEYESLKHRVEELEDFIQSLGPTAT